MLTIALVTGYPKSDKDRDTNYKSKNHISRCIRSEQTKLVVLHLQQQQQEEVEEEEEGENSYPMRAQQQQYPLLFLFFSFFQISFSFVFVCFVFRNSDDAIQFSAVIRACA